MSLSSKYSVTLVPEEVLVNTYFLILLVAISIVLIVLSSVPGLNFVASCIKVGGTSPNLFSEA